MKIKSKLARRLLIIAVVGFVLIGGAGGFYAYRKAAIRAKLENDRVEGLKAFAQGDNQTAVDDLGIYIARIPHPKDDAMIAYTKARPLLPLPHNEHLRTTIFVLRQLLNDKKDDELVEQRRQLLDLYIKTQLWVEAKAVADILLPKDTKEKAENAPLYADRARIAYALGAYDEALGYACTWVKYDRQNVEGQLMLLESARRTGKFADPEDKPDAKAKNAVELAEHMITAANKQPPTTQPSQLAARDALLRGFALYISPLPDDPKERSKQEDAERAELQKAAQFQFPDRRLTEMLINILDQLHMVDDSIALLQRLEKETGDPALHAHLARRLWELDDSKSVAAMLANLPIDDPKTDPELMSIDALSELILKNRARAEQIQKALSSRPDKDPTTAAWAAIVSSALTPKPGDALEITPLIEKALSVQKNPYLQFVLGRLQADRRDTDAALRSWKSSAQMSVTWARPLVYSAPLLSQAGKHQAAISAAWEGAMRAPHSVPAALTYVAVMDAAVDAGIVTNPEGELKWVNQHLTPNLSSSDTLLSLRVNLLGAAGKSPEAKALVQARLDDKRPIDQATLTRLLALSQKRHLDANIQADLQNRINNDFGQSLSVVAAKASKLIAQGKPQEGLQAFEEARKSAQDSQSLQWRFAWVQLLDRASDPRAKDQIIQLADNEKQDLAVQLFAADARATSADKTFQVSVESHVKEIVGDATAWRVVSARNLLRFSKNPAQDNKTALDLLQKALSDAPSNVQARLLLADVLDRLGRLPEALDQLKTAVAEHADSPELIVQYARALERAGNHDMAHDQLGRLRQFQDVAPQTRFTAAALALDTGDSKLALDLLGAATPVTTGELLLATRINLSNNQIDAAKSAFAKICASADAQPEALEAAAEFYNANGDTKSADDLVRRLSADTKSAPALYQLAQYNRKFFGLAKAVESLNQAIAADPKFAPARRELIESQLMLGQSKVAIATANAAGDDDKHLAALVTNGWLPLWDSAPEVRPLLIAYLRGGDANADWLKQCLDDRKPSISTDQLVENVSKRINQFPDVMALYTYATELRLRQGDLPSAAEWATRTARTFPASTEPQMALVGILHDLKRWPQVLAESQKLRDRLGPFAAPADVAIAKAYTEMGRPDDAVYQLKKYVEDPSKSRELYLAVLPTYAAALHRAGTADVSSVMEPLLKSDAQSRRKYMDFAREELKDDPARAIAWLDHAAPAIPDGALLEQLTLVDTLQRLYLYSTAKPQACLDRARRILEPLISAKEPNMMALVQLGMIAEYQDTKEAESIYRKVIANAPANSLAQFYAQNNLAMLLSKNDADLPEAAKLANSAAGMQFSVPAVFDTLAFIEHKQGHYPEALAAAQKALDLQPRDIQFRARLAQILLDLKRPSDADKVLRKIKDYEIDLTDARDEAKRDLADVTSRVAAALKATTTASK